MGTAAPGYTQTLWRQSGGHSAPKTHLPKCRAESEGIRDCNYGPLPSPFTGALGQDSGCVAGVGGEAALGSLQRGGSCHHQKCPSHHLLARALPGCPPHNPLLGKMWLPALKEPKGLQAPLPLSRPLLPGRVQRCLQVLGGPGWYLQALQSEHRELNCHPERPVSVFGGLWLHSVPHA